ncbi:unnamed protein product [Chondrus crispus]|uniref:Uncharacterized protein n=1 Tax=Chondrus crispus TaxID=2769 RepID=R7Q7Z8_CHOCR|nr:unnamed protein product [Chondrus crispus]CDF34677.1 unnamed protein product [Chondrus crispus]|eukprot:XP_005714496.1 unnamed protein product [Chondrus crispus]
MWAVLAPWGGREAPSCRSPNFLTSYPSVIQPTRGGIPIRSEWHAGLLRSASRTASHRTVPLLLLSPPSGLTNYHSCCSTFQATSSLFIVSLPKPRRKHGRRKRSQVRNQARAQRGQGWERCKGLPKANKRKGYDHRLQSLSYWIYVHHVGSLAPPTR